MKQIEMNDDFDLLENNYYCDLCHSEEQSDEEYKNIFFSAKAEHGAIAQNDINYLYYILIWKCLHMIE